MDPALARCFRSPATKYYHAEIAALRGRPGNEETRSFSEKAEDLAPRNDKKPRDVFVIGAFVVLVAGARPKRRLLHVAWDIPLLCQTP